MACALCVACASIPKGHYGVDTLRFEGVTDLDPDAIAACLATRQREKVSLGLGALRSPRCGAPPFDEPRRTARLFAFGFTEWPVYDEAVLKLDRERVERWYRARGYYGARVLDVSFTNPAAAESDSASCEGKACAVEIAFVIEEGEPVRVRKLELVGAAELAPAVQNAVRAGLLLHEGEVFDEEIYDRSRVKMAAALREAGYARAEVLGDIVVHRALHAADMRIEVIPGPRCRIGNIRIQSATPIPLAPVRAAALLKSGELYQESQLDDAQRAIYALGAFGSVTVRGDLEKPGDQIDILIELEPRRTSQVMIGAGLMSGVLSTGPMVDEAQSVPQWDVHLLASYEHRNFFGGLRRFRIEERPRMLFLAAFPGVPDNSPRFGNTLSATFAQPGVIEARTTLFVETRWDVGPDPFQLFFRHEFGVALGLERGFFNQRLQMRVAMHQELMEVSKRQEIIDRADAPSSYRLPFLDQRITLDLRDDSGNPRRGAFFRVAVQEAARLWGPSWNYVRVTPEARGYVPLGLGMVLASRFAIGALYILDASSDLDAEAQALGPQAYRLRGGGAQSNRGFLPGRLGTGFEGDALSGGVRRWEGSVELRIPLAESFSVALFTDVGDVNAETEFRFRNLNTSIGGGLRYRTIIGPIRFDVAGRPNGLQRIGGGEPDDATMNLGFTKFRGAMHLTIGEAF